MESEYNVKNRQRIVSVEDRQHWDDVFGPGKLYAVSSLRVCGVCLPSDSTYVLWQYSYIISLEMYHIETTTELVI
jgi:hypothetical protein